MQFQVPQFIETKTRILGPFTFEQSAYVLTGGVIIFIIQYTLSGNLNLILTVLVAALTLLFAYGSIGGMRFPTFLVRSFIFALTPKRFLYHKDQATEQDIVSQITNIPRAKK